MDAHVISRPLRHQERRILSAHLKVMAEGPGTPTVCVCVCCRLVNL